MRIAILTHNYPLQSSERKDAGVFLFDFAQVLAKKIEKVFIFCPNFAGEKENYQEVPVAWFFWHGGNKKLGSLKLWRPKDVFSFGSLLCSGRKKIIPFVKENKIDFCLAAWVFPNGLFALTAKQKLGIPYATWALGSDINIYAKYPLLKNLVKKILQNADLRFGNSFTICNKVKKLSGKSCEFLPAITTLNLENPKPARIDKNKFNFLYVGRLEKVKGVDLLLEAARNLLKAVNYFGLHIVGDGSLMHDLREKVNLWGLQENVFLLGNINDQDLLASYFLNCDFLVIPSRSESLPLTLIEAMRARLPVIASNVSDMGFLVSKNNLGLVFPAENKEALFECMKNALESGKKFKEKYQANLSKAAAQFDLETAAEGFVKICQKSGF